jgi:hypothetical protein
MNLTRAEVHLSMALNRLTRIVMGVPNVTDVASYYRDFGLTPTSGEHCFGTVDGGEQLKLVTTVRRRLVELGVGVDDHDDLARVASRLDKLGDGASRDHRPAGSAPDSDTDLQLPGKHLAGRCARGQHPARR